MFAAATQITQIKTKTLPQDIFFATKIVFSSTLISCSQVQTYYITVLESSVLGCTQRERQHCTLSQSNATHRRKKGGKGKEEQHHTSSVAGK